MLVLELKYLEVKPTMSLHVNKLLRHLKKNQNILKVKQSNDEMGVFIKNMVQNFGWKTSTTWESKTCMRREHR
jgi:hypothetical protein